MMNVEFLLGLASIIPIAWLNYKLLSYIFPLSKAKGVFFRAIFSTLFYIGVVGFFEKYALIGVVKVFFLFSFTFYYASMFGRFSYGSVGSILESNRSEIKEFYSSLNKANFVKSMSFGFVYSASLYYIHSSVISDNVVFYYLESLSFLMFILSLASIAYIYYVKDSNAKVPLKILKYNSLFNSLVYFAEYFKYKRMLRRIKVTSEWKDVSRTSNNTEVYVVVIGESACKSHYHVYGYGKPTTPPICDMKGYNVIREAVAPATQTMTSIPRILACNNIEDGVNFNLNVIDLANQAGFETYWLSNQGELGHADRPIAAIANRATHKEYLQLDYTRAGSDFELLELMKKHLDSSSDKPKLFFMHTMGSHWDFRERSALGKYHLDNIKNHIDCYDDTIYNSYMLLEDIRDLLSEIGVSHKICYFSDHGLSASDDFPNLIHGAGNYFSYEAAMVPLFFIDENESAGRFTDKTYYLRDFVHSFGDWLSIDALQLKRDYSILNSEMLNQEQYILDDSLNIIKRDI
ncbi:sulfatase-like hydrolase/transferase [Vibrio alfacsensis]|uniref:sulfatase-like hydrolase/transferase n=1 Tax=Vibrio alfacsensis TaxID=1074311 RepID=UPI004068D0A0